MKLYSPATVKQIIEKHKFYFQKNLGQNFLIDGNIINKIVGAAEIDLTDAVLEIGAGIGTLTRALAQRAGRVVVIEIDKNLLPILDETLGDCENIDIVVGNALKLDFDEIMAAKTGGMYGSGGKPYKIVANLPYYITTPLIMHALESHCQASSLVIMVQKEVAQRIAADPGNKDYGALTLAVNYYSEPELVMKVPKNVFMPAPEVESAVVRLRQRQVKPWGIDDEQTFFRVVRSAFGQRRKTLSNSIAPECPGMDKQQVMEMLTGLGIEPNRRGETLSIAEFARIANEIYKKTAD